MKQIIILTVIITAGIVGIIAFSCGALLTRPSKIKFEQAEQSKEKALKAKQEEIETIKKDTQAIIEALHKNIETTANSQLAAKKSEQHALSGVGKLFEEIKKLKDELASCTVEYAEAAEELEKQRNFISVNGIETIPQKFDFRNIQISRNEYGTVTILGEAESRQYKAYRYATFEVSIYDNSDKLLDVGTFTLEVVKRGEIRPFKMYFYNTDCPVAYCKIKYSSMPY